MDDTWLMQKNRKVFFTNTWSMHDKQADNLTMEFQYMVNTGQC